MFNKVAILLGKQSETGRVFQGAPTRLMAKAGVGVRRCGGGGESK
jgi:hypothetical protein